MKREELASIVAFDILVTGADNKFNIGDFTQSGSD